MATERDFTWLDGERLIRFGGGALAAAPDLLRSRGFEGYALLTTARAREQAPALAEAAGTVLEVPPGTVPDAASAVREGVGGRPVVALGGGRVVDSAKAIGAADELPVAAVATTLSGAELTGFHRLPAGVEGRKLVRPSVVVADPAVMGSQPMPGVAASAMNALAHAVEALYTPFANPVAGMAALRGAELIADALAGDGEPDREALALGAVLAGYASGATGYAVHHVVCQTIVRIGGTPHAETNATMLPHTIRLMRERAPAQIEAVERALGGGGGADGLAARAGVDGLRGLGFDAARVGAVVEAVLPRPELQNTPRPPDEAELRAFVEGAL